MAGLFSEKEWNQTHLVREASCFLPLKLLVILCTNSSGKCLLRYCSHALLLIRCHLVEPHFSDFFRVPTFSIPHSIVIHFTPHLKVSIIGMLTYTRTLLARSGSANRIHLLSSLYKPCACTLYMSVLLCRPKMNKLLWCFASAYFLTLQSRVPSPILVLSWHNVAALVYWSPQLAITCDENKKRKN